MSINNISYAHKIQYINPDYESIEICYDDDHIGVKSRGDEYYYNISKYDLGNKIDELINIVRSLQDENSELRKALIRS